MPMFVNVTALQKRGSAGAWGMRLVIFIALLRSACGQQCARDSTCFEDVAYTCKSCCETGKAATVLLRTLGMLARPIYHYTARGFPACAWQGRDRDLNTPLCRVLLAG